MTSPDHSPRPKPTDDKPPAESTLHYEFEQLAGDTNEVHITYLGQTYRLRRTRNDRLILTK